jgi:hypothetical protein
MRPTSKSYPTVRGDRVGVSKEVTMSESPLSRYAGPIAIFAGGLFAAAHVGQFLVMDRSDLVAMMTDPVFLIFNAAYPVLERIAVAEPR